MPEAIDAMRVPSNSLVLRFARDEALVVGTSEPADIAIEDRYAVVVTDGGWSGSWLDFDRFEEHVAVHVEWRLPTARPALAQGLVAAVPAKLWFDADRVLVLTPSAYLAELAARIGPDQLATTP